MHYLIFANHKTLREEKRILETQSYSWREELTHADAALVSLEDFASFSRLERYILRSLLLSELKAVFTRVAEAMSILINRAISQRSTFFCHVMRSSSCPCLGIILVLQR